MTQYKMLLFFSRPGHFYQ